MAEDLNNPIPAEQEESEAPEDTLGARFMEWVRTELVWYAGSFTFHLLGLSILLLLGNFASDAVIGDAPSFDEVSADKADSEEPTKFEKFDIADADDSQPTELDVDPTLEKPGHEAVKEDYIDDNPVYQPKGGGMATGTKEMGMGGGIGFWGVGNGAKSTGAGIGVGLGTGKGWGSGGDGTGFGGRGSGHRKAMVAQYGGTKHTERAVTGALIWLARHQLSDGSWSLQNYVQRCTDGSCTGPGDAKADSGATAMGLLPFFAAGQTHKTKGPYRANIAAGINWLIRHQKPDGDLRFGNAMYSHGLAAIALCEAYGLSGDRNVGLAAQGAVNFVMNAQNKVTGGWRYTPGDPGDTSVVGWQVMALKSAVMAGLNVGGSNFGGSSKWLDSCQKGAYNSTYSYTPDAGATPTMTAVGLLCRQYLGAKRDNPMMIEGIKYLMNTPPTTQPKIYYYYYATQVLHNMSGYEWDTWNRKMRRILVDTQCKDSSTCANGSWDPGVDPHGKSGGRIMITSLSCLTLEIYYRYLPLFKAEAEGGAVPVVPKADEQAAPAKAAPAAKAAPEAKGAPAAKGAPDAKDAPEAKGVPAAKEPPAKTSPAKAAPAKAKGKAKA